MNSEKSGASTSFACALVCLFALSGCGQVFFDTLTDSSVDASVDDVAIDDVAIDDAFQDGSRDALVADAGPDGVAPDVGDAGAPDAGADSGPGWRSDENACAAADRGPFVEVARIATPDVAYGLWYRAPFLLSAETNGGFASYRFDGASFGEVDRVGLIGFAEGIWADGDTFVVGAPGRGLFRISIDAVGRLTVLSETNGVVVDARQAWGSGGTLFVPSGPQGLVAMVPDAVGYAPVATFMSGFGQGVFAVGDRVWYGDGSALWLLRYAASTFTELASIAGGFSRVWVTDSAVFTGEGTRVLAFAPDDDTLTPRAVGTTAAGRVREVWSDGVHLFAACGSGGVEAFAEEDGVLNSLDRVPTGGTETLGVVGDGEYIFVSDGAAGLRAFSGFACTRLR